MRGTLNMPIRLPRVFFVTLRLLPAASLARLRSGQTLVAPNHHLGRLSRDSYAHTREGGDMIKQQKARMGRILRDVWRCCVFGEKQGHDSGFGFGVIVGHPREKFGV